MWPQTRHGAQEAVEGERGDGEREKSPRLSLLLVLRPPAISSPAASLATRKLDG